MTDDITALVERLRIAGAYDPLCFDAASALTALKGLSTRLAESDAKLTAAQARIEELEANAVDKAGAWDAIAEKNRRLAEVEKERDEANATADEYGQVVDNFTKERDALWNRAEAAETERDAAQARIEHLEAACRWHKGWRDEAVARLAEVERDALAKAIAESCDEMRHEYAPCARAIAAEKERDAARAVLKRIADAPAWGYPGKWETTPAEVRQIARSTLSDHKTEGE